MEYININNINIEVEYKPIKNIHLSVYPPNGRVHISAPETMKKESVRLYAIFKLSWVKRQIEKVQNQERQTPREYVSGENHYFKGLRYRLNVIERNASPKIELQGRRYIKMYVRPGSTIEKKEEVLREWYRDELKQILKPMVSKWENILQVKVSYWEVKQMKTLWGSCNTRTKRIIFNLELAKKPVYCIEYIVTHELAHLIERLHNATFTALLDVHLPDWQRLKDELNEFTV
ncbi:MAG: M48 family metallopeptidase [Dysgonamonadaceae bacterium]|jgi:predicted metal-dependent hydrolase|nr:M48 family metallopeptidase [Dysgonamonadaceae bacterium]